jgi:hypothetical protein
MALSTEDLAEIDKVLSSPEAGGASVMELRRRFPHYAWTQCDASDVTELPFRTYPRFDVHLLNSADHCAQVTSDPAHATGIVLAKRAGIS